MTVNFAPSLAAVGNAGTITLGANALLLPSYTTVQGLTAGSGYTLANLITIQGGGHIAFSLDGSVVNAALNNLIITGGSPALSTAGVVTVSQCTFTQNAAGSGGAISSSGTLTVLNTTFSGNTATTYGAAIFSSGPSTGSTVASTRNLTISGSTFQGNSSATDGGAIYIGRYSVGSIDSSTFTGNSAAHEGAAIYVNNASSLSRVTNSILSGDTGRSECAGYGCDGAARAFVFDGSEPNGATDQGNITMTVTLSTGEILIFNAPYGQFSSGASLASIFGAYISGNSSLLAAQGIGSTLAMVPYRGTITSVVFRNPSAYFTVTPMPDAIISGSGNLVAVGSSVTNLSALGGYGGPTKTLLPLPGSLALCAITPLSAAGTDQRVLPRTTLYGTTLCQDSGAVQTNYGLAFLQQPASTNTNAILLPAPSVQLQESGQTASQADNLITLKDRSGTLSGSTYSRTVSTGVATFPNLIVTKTQAADALAASIMVGGNSVGTTSTAFDVSAQATATLSGSAVFPPTAVNATTSQIFNFSNTGSTTLTITTLAVSAGPEFLQTNTCGLGLAAGANCSIVISFQPVVSGARRGTLTLVSDAAGYTQSVALTGTGVTVDATLTGADTFPSTQVGNAAAAQGFTLLNTGTSPLAISNIAVTGDFSQINNCGSSLATGTSCFISVVFKPAVSGSRAGSLVVSTNATTALSPIALIGSGFTVAGTLVGAGSFPTTSVGSASSSQIFTLTNTGTSTLGISGVASTSDFSQTNQCGSSLTPNATCTIAVAFQPTTSGARSGVLTVATNATTAIAPAALSGIGILVQGSLSSGAGFAPTAVGASSQPQVFVLSNTGNDTLVLNGINATGDFSQANNCGTTLAVGATCTVSAIFTPTALGVRTGSLTVGSNAKVAILPAALSGTGVAPPTFSLGDSSSGVSSTAITVPAGGTATGALRFTSTNGFSGSIIMSCAAQGAAPAGATCTVSSPVMLAAGGTATATVTITTTSRTQSAGLVPLPGRSDFTYLIPAGFFSLALLRLRSAGNRVRVGSLTVLVLTLSISIVGCGGAATSKTAVVTNPNGTPTGTFTYIVTASSNGVTAAQTILLSVQ